MKDPYNKPWDAITPRTRRKLHEGVAVLVVQEQDGWHVVLEGEQATRSVHSTERGAKQAATLLAADTSRQRHGLSDSERDHINMMLKKAGLDGNTYFEKPDRGYAAAWDVLNRHGLVVDDAVSPHRFSHRPSGSLNLILARKTADPYTNHEIHDHRLVLTYHEMQSGRFEVIVYVS